MDKIFLESAEFALLSRDFTLILQFDNETELFDN
jgi:hypothetical protein